MQAAKTDGTERGTHGIGATVCRYWPGDAQDDANGSGQKAEAAPRSPVNSCSVLEAWIPRKGQSEFHQKSRLKLDGVDRRDLHGALIPTRESGHKVQKTRTADGCRDGESGDFDGALTQNESRIFILSEDIIIRNILANLDSISLSRTRLTCRKLLAVVDVSAKVAMEKWQEEQSSWSGHLNPLEKLQLAEAFCGFQKPRSKTSLLFSSNDSVRITDIHLQGNGPILLLSDSSTLDKPVLRWRVQVLGNSAIEFGVVPVDIIQHYDSIDDCEDKDDDIMPDDGYEPQRRYPALDQVLHKAKLAAARGGMRVQAQGFASSNTHGSELAGKMKILKGSTVEIVASAQSAEYRVTHLDGATEKIYPDLWGAEGQPFQGPKETILKQSFRKRADVKLGCTLWARGHIRVLHPAVNLE